jgi:hypothetical protein
MGVRSLHTPRTNLAHEPVQGAVRANTDSPRLRTQGAAPTLRATSMTCTPLGRVLPPTKTLRSMSDQPDARMFTSPSRRR